MNTTVQTRLWWKCPICEDTVDFTAELLGSLFAEDTGEAFFDTTEQGGVLFHTVFCYHCGASWTISISGLEKEFMNDNA